MAYMADRTVKPFFSPFVTFCLFSSFAELHSWEQPGSVCGRVTHHSGTEYPLKYEVLKQVKKRCMLTDCCFMAVNTKTFKIH